MHQAFHQLTATVSGSQATSSRGFTDTTNPDIQMHPRLRDVNHASILHQTHSQPAAVMSSGQAAALAQDTIQRVLNDSILPDLHVFRHNPCISQSVSQILSTYDAKTRQESIHGNPARVKKSGRLNTTDTVTAVPEAR